MQVTYVAGKHRPGTILSHELRKCEKDPTRKDPRIWSNKIRLTPFDPNYGDPVPASLRGDLLLEQARMENDIDMWDCCHSQLKACFRLRTYHDKKFNRAKAPNCTWTKNSRKEGDTLLEYTRIKSA